MSLEREKWGEFGVLSIPYLFSPLTLPYRCSCETNIPNTLHFQLNTWSKKPYFTTSLSERASHSPYKRQTQNQAKRTGKDAPSPPPTFILSLPPDPQISPTLIANTSRDEATSGRARAKGRERPSHLPVPPGLWLGILFSCLAQRITSSIHTYIESMHW